jgi:hypothetical protein
MNEIGGYFGLELVEGPYAYHGVPYTFKSGRSSLRFILEITRPALVYIPFYTCDGLLEPFHAMNISYRFYPINQLLEPNYLPELQENEYFLYINYFDIKRAFAGSLSDKYRDRLIVDCTQAFFMQGNGVSWFFNSCRKFFGVPDGSFLYPPEGTDMSDRHSANEDYLLDHLMQRFNGHIQEGYPFFLLNENMCGGGVAGMSKLSAYLLSNIDYGEIIRRRRGNYNYLDNVFESTNLLWIEPGNECVPMMYPLLLNKPPDRKRLAGDDIFIPTFWEDVLRRDHGGFDIERSMSGDLLPLPVDHRYGAEDMRRIASLIKSII